MTIYRLSEQDLRLNSKVRENLTEIGTEAEGEVASRFQFNGPHFLEHWAQAVESGRAVFLGAHVEGRIVGVMVISVWFDDFSGVETAAKQHWYVLKAFRHTRAGYALWRAFQRVTAGVPNVMTSTPKQLELGQTEFYRRCGFEPGSRVFVKV